MAKKKQEKAKPIKPVVQPRRIIIILTAAVVAVTSYVALASRAAVKPAVGEPVVVSLGFPYETAKALEDGRYEFCFNLIDSTPPGQERKYNFSIISGSVFSKSLTGMKTLRGPVCGSVRVTGGAARFRVGVDSGDRISITSISYRKLLF